MTKRRLLDANTIKEGVKNNVQMKYVKASFTLADFVTMR